MDLWPFKIAHVYFDCQPQMVEKKFSWFTKDIRLHKKHQARFISTFNYKINDSKIYFNFQRNTLKITQQKYEFYINKKNQHLSKHGWSL